MSRICGIINPDRKTKHLTIPIEDLMAPMRHTAKYNTEVEVSDDFAFGRIYFRNNNTSTFMAKRFYKGSSCVFCGYITELDDIIQQIHRETQGRIKISNPAELISYVILENGPEDLLNLNGIFAFALWQSNSNTLMLGVDRFGMRPLYYLNQAKTVCFASEIKSLGQTQANISLNHDALEEMFVFGFLLGDKTLINGINRVPPASVLIFNGNTMKKSRYWWFDRIHIDPHLGVDDYIIENERLFYRAVRKTSNEYESVSCLLSSGYDSRRIILELTRLGKRISSYTVGYSKPSDNYEIDYNISKKISMQLGTKHTVVDQANPEEEPLNIFNMFTLLDFESDEHQFIMPLLPEIPVNGDINFDGLGGDILINGLFLKEDILAVIHDNKKVAQKILTYNPNLWSSYTRLKGNGPDLEERIIKILNDLPDSPNKLTQFFFINRTRREIALFPYGLLSLKIESILPYLDYDLVNQSLSLSPILKLGSNLQEKILRLNYNEFMNNIPNSHYNNISTNPDEFCRHYCRPLDDYWTKLKKYVLMESSGKLLSSRGFFASLKLKAIIATLAFPVLNFFDFSPESVMEKSWSLRKLGQIALLYKMTKNRDYWKKQLFLARKHVFRDD